MPIPSGNGSEVLKNVNGTVANTTTTLFTVDTNHIITVLSIIIHNTTGDSSAGGIKVNNGSTDYALTYQTIGGLETFVFNDKIVLHPTHILKLYESSNKTNNYWVTYIEQDWS